MSQGILSSFLNQIASAGIPIRPEIMNNELVIKIDQNEFYDAVTRGLTPDQKSAIRLELHEGYILIRVKLF